MDDLAVHEQLISQGLRPIETHISRVYLARDDVYKLKRPVNLGFLDFTSFEARLSACRAEVALNRRLAPDVYLGVVALTRLASGKLAFVPYESCAAGEALDVGVHMRRLDDAARADVRLAAGQLAPAEVEDIARTLARFHRAARCDAETSRYGAPDCIRINVEENFSQIGASVARFLSQDEYAALQGFQRAFLSEREGLLEARVREGFVRDGHGDLRLEHIYREDAGAHVIIDCIEFNERFRFADVCADLSFLSMDLRVQGRPDLAERLLSAYAHESQDMGLYALIDFYESYRAVVRAKVASFLCDDHQVAEATRERAQHAARKYYVLALSASRPALARPRLILCMGMMASGKSTLAESLAREVSLPVLSADRTRKLLLGVDETAPLHDAAFSGAYTPALQERVYAELKARAAEILRSRRSAIVDATFRDRAQRAHFAELAAATGADLFVLECRCAREVAFERLHDRARRPSISDGRAEIYDAVARSFEPVSADEAGTHVLLDTSGPLGETLSRALSVVTA